MLYQLMRPSVVALPTFRWCVDLVGRVRPVMIAVSLSAGSTVRCMSDGKPASDWRYQELQRLGERERSMAKELHDVRETIARIVKELAPHHAPKDRINDVVMASGYSRALIEAMRGGENVWTRL
ncbi:hypothetical protein [Actinomadura sp. 3N508]|uniref:hypothetical protein n=1 Tax=Actinomadura sp. 3N508 TaxID=3375153 RepID=UPI0037A0CED0